MAVPSDDDFVEDVGEMIEYTMDLGREATPDGQALAAAVKSLIRDKYQGDRVRIKKGQKKCQHADKIKAEFDGTNVTEIMERYGVSRSTVYRCLGD